MALTLEDRTDEETVATRHLRVYRVSGGNGDAHFDEFDVPIAECTTLLDALRWIQLHRDPSLSLRHSCARMPPAAHAVCG